ncbi:hypothetical protein M0811_01763 [Anaeramoeba ignava]|uniref:E1 ubiquitin-activating enzyme n=1 Tax=Anaeramoeba ignava TaxID=1746090 RepID=A0A9Q0R860_ANAIG|nr:hypothetical protein M0811_01763 [Anaeramoeba ignava]
MDNNIINQEEEDQYSRQLLMLGKEAMLKMAQSKVLLVGLSGLGAEIAKNVILARVKKITLWDKELTQIEDLSANFFLTEEDIGKNRVEVSYSKFAELNEHVQVDFSTKELDEEFIKEYTVVVLCSQRSLTEIFRIGDICHKNNIQFIVTDTLGVFGFCFNDFGKEFVVADPKGEPPLKTMIGEITKEENAKVTNNLVARHGFETIINPFEFLIGDTKDFHDYSFEGSGGYATQVITPIKMDFDSIKESIEKPKFFISDDAKEKRPIQLHLGFQAIYQYMEENKRQFLEPHADSVVEEILKKMEEKNSTFETKIEIDKELITKLVYSSTGELSPMCAFFGGIVGQEVLKACSAKYTPINQWMYFDAIECLPKNYLEMPLEEFKSDQKTRYSTQISVLGKKVDQMIHEQKYFMVGAGAIGCEMLKNWAMIGLGTSDNGFIHLTDMDSIERSNLNRQFLFRPWDIKKMKSEVATNAAKKMNSDLNIIPHSDRVGQETEKFYNDDFFESLTGVCNALDNVEARKYVDSRCVFYHKPLLESGTLGQKGNTQVIIPKLTVSYSDSVDVPDTSIPLCTLHNFPNKIEHTIEWARDLFEGLFHNAPQNLVSFISDPLFLSNLEKKPTPTKIETLEQIIEDLVDNKPETYEQCVEWARNVFEDNFHNIILQLLFMFPKDAKNSYGDPFWHGEKRPPTEAKFDINNNVHVGFILSAANLRAQIYGIPKQKDLDKIRQIIPNSEVKKFSPRDGFKALTDDKGEVTEIVDETLQDEDRYEMLLKKLPDPEKFKEIEIKVHKFEKDDDTNFHIDFITAASTIRAINYDIEPVGRLETKGIAGRIIPAIATTTASVTGLVCLELYKLIQEDKVLEDFKNAYFNLALPYFGFANPIQSFKYTGKGDQEFTIWDQYKIKGDLTVQQLEDFFVENHKIIPTMINAGNSLIYNAYNPSHKERKNQKITDLYQSISKKQLYQNQKYLSLNVLFDDSEAKESIENSPIVTLILRD